MMPQFARAIARRRFCYTDPRRMQQNVAPGVPARGSGAMPQQHTTAHDSTGDRPIPMGSRQPRILIAGGGIGGMAAALALLRAGCDVEVCEQANEEREVGAGVQITPNGSLALRALGVFDTLYARSCPPDARAIFHWQTGKRWTTFAFKGQTGQVTAPYPAPYVMVYRPDLLAVLADAVRALKPDAVRLETRCTGFDQDDTGVTLRFASGGYTRGDLLIGADGVHSPVRAQLFGEDGSDTVRYSGLCIWRAVIPAERVPWNMRERIGANWIGPDGHVVHYYLRNGTLMNFAATREQPVWDAPQWKVDSSIAACERALSGWHPDLLGLMRAAPAISKWALLVREPLATWTQGRVTLLGDACHPTLPFLGQGANMAIEDGVVLAQVIAAAQRAGQDAPSALQRYEALRRERTHRMVREAAAFRPRFHNEILRDPVKAEDYIHREWSPEKLRERFDWVFRHDVGQAAA